MIAPTVLLLAMLIPSPDVAPIHCPEYREQGTARLGVIRFLTPSGQFVSESVSWNVGEPGGPGAAADWMLPPGAVVAPRLDLLAFTFFLPRAPAGPVRVRVEADRREVARLSVVPDVEQYRGQYVVTIRLMRPPFPGLPPDGPVPEIGAAVQVGMTLETADGMALGTVVLPLPDWRTVAPLVEEARRGAIAKAGDFRRSCVNLRSGVPVTMPPPLPSAS